MPNIAAALKEEVARISRKELRASTDALKKTVSTYRAEIAALKRRVTSLERQVTRTAKPGRTAQQESIEQTQSLRFRPDGLKKHRERLGLSAADVAKLIGCSSLSVYKWESGKTRPREKQLAAIAQLRTMGKRQAAAKLEEMSN